MEFLHHRNLTSLMNPLRGEFSLKYVKKSTGKIIEFKNWVCLSWHSSGNTVNIKNPANGQVRKLQRCLIIEFNGVEVIL